MAGLLLRPPPAGYWALAPVLASLRRELLKAYPAVPASAYGTVGDQAHRLRKSDHNPDQRGYVRALDIPYIEHGGVPLPLLAEFLRQVGATQSQRLNPGGYVVYNRRTASARTRWKWSTYLGDDPHLRHLHVSCSLLPHFYVLNQPWNVASALERMG